MVFWPTYPWVIVNNGSREHGVYFVWTFIIENTLVNNCNKMATYTLVRIVAILWIVTALFDTGFPQNLQTINIREFIKYHSLAFWFILLLLFILFFSKNRLYRVLLNNVIYCSVFVFNANTVFINDRTNLVAEETFGVALNYIRRNPRVGLMIDGLYSVKIGGDDAAAILETRKSTFYT